MGGFSDKSDVERVMGGGAVDKTADRWTGVENVAVVDVEVFELQIGGTEEPDFFCDIEEEINIAVFRSVFKEEVDRLNCGSHSSFVISTEDGCSVGFDEVAIFNNFEPGGRFDGIKMGGEENCRCVGFGAGESGNDVSSVAVDFGRCIVFGDFQPKFDEIVFDVVNTFTFFQCGSVDLDEGFEEVNESGFVDHGL